MAAPADEAQHLTATRFRRRSTAITSFSTMNSFIATAPAGTASRPDVVENDGWFPDIDLGELRTAMRLDGTVTAERLREAVIDAIASANAELATWRDAQLAAGHTSLADVPAPAVGGGSVQLARYRRAVYHLAHADLTERYRDYDATKSGGQKADDLEATTGDARRNARWALNDLRGIARTTVELI